MSVKNNVVIFKGSGDVNSALKSRDEDQIVWTRVSKSHDAYLYDQASKRKLPVTLIYAQALYIMLNKKPHNDGLRWIQLRDDEYDETGLITPKQIAIPKHLGQWVVRESSLYHVSVDIFSSTALHFYSRYVFPSKPYPDLYYQEEGVALMSSYRKQSEVDEHDDLF